MSESPPSTVPPSPERAVRLLRAKAAELAAHARRLNELSVFDPAEIEKMLNDIALVAQLLADHIEESLGG